MADQKMTSDGGSTAIQNYRLKTDPILQTGVTAPVGFYFYTA